MNDDLIAAIIFLSAIILFPISFSLAIRIANKKPTKEKNYEQRSKINR